MFKEFVSPSMYQAIKTLEKFATNNSEVLEAKKVVGELAPSIDRKDLMFEFILSTLETDPKGSVSKRELNACWERYCGKRGVNTQNPVWFYKHLWSIAPEGWGHGRAMVDGKRLPSVLGVRFTDKANRFLEKNVRGGRVDAY